MDLTANILKVLQEEKGTLLPTLQIAKKVGLKTTKEVNPTLYALLKSGEVEKISEEGGRNPKWKVVEKE